MPTKCSRHVSTAIKGGQFKHKLLSPAFVAISGRVCTPSTYSSPPNTPTTVYIVLQSSYCLVFSQWEQAHTQKKTDVQCENIRREVMYKWKCIKNSEQKKKNIKTFNPMKEITCEKFMF